MKDFGYLGSLERSGRRRADGEVTEPQAELERDSTRDNGSYSRRMNVCDMGRGRRTRGMSDDAGGAVAAANVLLVPVQHLDKAAEEHQNEASNT